MDTRRSTSVSYGVSAKGYYEIQNNAYALLRDKRSTLIIALLHFSFVREAREREIEMKWPRNALLLGICETVKIHSGGESRDKNYVNSRGDRSASSSSFL